MSPAASAADAIRVTRRPSPGMQIIVNRLTLRVKNLPIHPG